MDGNAGREITFDWGGVSILGLREKGIALSGEPIDTTSDENNGWRKLLTIAGQSQVTISLSGVTKTTELKENWFSGNRTKTVTITYPDGSVLQGVFFLATLNDTGPYNEATTFEATLESTGEVTFTPYS